MKQIDEFKLSDEVDDWLYNDVLQEIEADARLPFELALVEARASGLAEEQVERIEDAAGMIVCRMVERSFVAGLEVAAGGYRQFLYTQRPAQKGELPSYAERLGALILERFPGAEFTITAETGTEELTDLWRRLTAEHAGNGTGAVLAGVGARAE